MLTEPGKPNSAGWASRRDLEELMLQFQYDGGLLESPSLLREIRFFLYSTDWMSPTHIMVVSLHSSKFVAAIVV